MSIIPTDEDHPDFTRPSQFTSAPVLAVTTTAVAASPALASFYTGGYESLVVKATNQAAGVGWVYTFDWFGDQAMTEPAGSLNLRTLSAIPISAQVANRGPWCRVTVTTTSVVAHGFTILVIPRTGTPSGAGAFLDGLIHGISAQLIGPGATVSQNAFGLTPGEAALSVNTGAALWSAKVFGFDELSAATGVYGALNGTGGTSQTTRMILPAGWTQIQVTNGDGVNRFFDWAVQAAL